MFGESDSESPRVPSPWDSLTQSPSSLPSHNEDQGIPKLVPEAEEGNVEYKLQLLSPSPARFARLVTQLKWRLLEGGGRAYYEIGVADSGTLVGLPRQQLEESLETLEMMASEIGASVIVVKEVEVPPKLSGLTESQLERSDGKRSTRRKDLLRMIKQDTSLTTSTTDFEVEMLHIDAEAEETTNYSPPTSPASSAARTNHSQSRLLSIPFPSDPALAIFTMDLGDDVANGADNEVQDDDVLAGRVTKFPVSLEILSVNKPRSMKNHAMHVASPPAHSDYTKKFQSGYSSSKFVDTICPTGDSVAQDPFETPPKPREARVQPHRGKRDGLQELQLTSLPTHVLSRHSIDSPTISANQLAVPSCFADELNPVAPNSPCIVMDSELPLDGASETTTIASKEPRLIVEVLVVRKLLSNEGFLDFEGFSVQ